MHFRCTGASLGSRFSRRSPGSPKGSQRPRTRSRSVGPSDQRFQPTELKVPANTPVTLVIRNLDPTPEEFESKTLRGGPPQSPPAPARCPPGYRLDWPWACYMEGPREGNGSVQVPGVSELQPPGYSGGTPGRKRCFRDLTFFGVAAARTCDLIVRSMNRHSSIRTWALKTELKIVVFAFSIAVNARSSGLKENPRIATTSFRGHVYGMLQLSPDASSCAACSPSPFIKEACCIMACCIVAACRAARSSSGRAGDGASPARPAPCGSRLLQTAVSGLCVESSVSW